MALTATEKARRFSEMKKVLTAISKLDDQLDELKTKKKDLDKAREGMVQQLGEIAFNPQQTLDLEGEAE